MSYRLVVAHSGRDELAQALKNAVSKALSDTNIDAGQLEISEELSDNGVNQALAYLASEEGRADRKVNAKIQQALDTNVPIIPIAMNDEEPTVAEKLPESLSQHNAAFWQDDGVSVAISLLRTLGLVESERKIFISYRRSETSNLADQLHTALVQRGFNVFLDRFSLYPGDHLPHRIEENLADKALVLLLESNGLQQSEWVLREIDYAVHNHIGILALNLPDCENSVTKIDDKYRFRLTPGDLTKQRTLKPHALARNIEDIDLAHAEALHRRRLQLLDYVTRRLRYDGDSYELVGAWSVLAIRNEGKDAHLFWLAPRLPAISDFYGLYRLHQRLEGEISQDLKGAVVYDLPHILGERQELMDWLATVSDKGLTQIEDF